MNAGPPYSFLRHLAWSVWLNHDPARCWMTILTGYYDASGSEKTRTGALVVVGGVSTEEKWLKFETEWNAALQQYEVPYFHMREFASCVGPFASWKGNEELRRAFLETLIAILKRRVHKFVSSGVILPDFAKVDTEYRLSEAFGGPYSLCAGTAMRQAENWRKKRHRPTRMYHIYEAGDHGWGAFINFAASEGIYPAPKPKVDPETGEWFAPFQGIDLLCWEDRRAYNDVGEENPRELRGSFNAIRRMLPRAAGVHDEKTLRAMCETNPDRLPPRTSLRHP